MSSKMYADSPNAATTIEPGIAAGEYESLTDDEELAIRDIPIHMKCIDEDNNRIEIRLNSIQELICIAERHGKFAAQIRAFFQRLARSGTNEKIKLEARNALGSLS